MFGHYVDKCYKKHGYPPRYKTGSKNYTSVANQMENSFNYRLDTVETQEYDTKGKQPINDPSAEQSNLFFTKEQYNKISALIQSGAPGCSL